MKFFMFLLFFVFLKFPYHPHIEADYFAPPLKIPLYLAGNFGELRSNHFHSGIDIKTQGRTGLPVYAAADGSVSRINISPVGFGLALYIDHPNGYTTVYGHLDHLRDDLAAYAKNIQYENQNFAVDIPVPPGKFKLSKGELIAYSGNSGSSGGPHLHFEIRDTGSEHPINPLLFNFKIADQLAPKLYSVLVYPLSNKALVAGKANPQRYETVVNDNTYQLKDSPVITVSGEIGFGIQTLDFLDGSPSKCGVYEIDLRVNGELIYSFKMNEMSFDESRYINSHIDYGYLYNYNRRYHKSWVEDGNRLNNYPVLEHKGIIEPENGKTYTVSYLIKDAKGNSSRLNFLVLGQAAGPQRPDPAGIPIRYNADKLVQGPHVTAQFEEGTFYSDFMLDYKEKATAKSLCSPVIQLHQADVPVQKYYQLKIKPEGLPAELESKALIVAIDPQSGQKSAIGGSFNDGWVETLARQLGSFAVATDTQAPTITAVNIQNHSTLTNRNKVSFKLNDDLSGISTYRGEIDGQWVLFEYDAKNSLLEYRFDPQRLPLGQIHRLKLTVADAKGNESVYNAKFYR